MRPVRPAGRPSRRWPWAVLLILGVGAGGWRAASTWTRSADDPDQLFREAQAEHMARRPGRAEALLDRLARLRAPTAADWMLRARVVGARGRLDEALADLAKIPDGHPQAPAARLLQGQIERDRDRARKAEAALHRALELDPKLVQARRELIYLYGLQLRRADLRTQFLAMGEAVPLKYEDLYLLCLSRGVLWEPVESAALLGRLLKADPDDRASRLALADNLRRLNRLDEVEALLALLPGTDPAARAMRAEIALDHGDAGRVEAILAGGPDDDLDVARLRGRLALARRDWPAAARHFRAALAADPLSRDALRGLGQALAGSGDAAGARPYLEAARAHDRLATLIQRAATTGSRNDPSLLRELGDACRDARLFPEARAWYRLAIDRDPLDAKAQRAVYDLDAAEQAEKPTRARAR